MDHLMKLQCHFTWNLMAEDVDISNVEEKVNDQIVFLPDAYKHRMYNLLAYLKHLKGDHDGALLELQRAEAQIPDFSTSEDTDFRKTVMYGNFAWVFYHQNQFSMSSTYSTKVETILKKYESQPMLNTLLLDIYGEQGWSYLSYSGKYYERAAECFKKALELDPEDPELNSGYATAVYRIEGLSTLCNPTKESIPLLERAVKLNPRDTVVKTLLALKYARIKKYDEGVKLIEQALKEQPQSPYVLRYVATFYKRNGQTEKAITVLKKADHLTPNSTALQYQLAVCYEKLIRMPHHFYKQQNAEAISNAIFHANKLKELNNTYVGGYLILADVYVKTNEHQKAEEEFAKAQSISTIRCEQKQELHFKWAKYLLNSRKSESEAVKHFKEAIMIQNPTFFKAKAIKELNSLAQTMIARNSQDAAGYALLGLTNHQSGQDSTAIKYYKKALVLEPDNQEYLEACSALQAT